MGSGPSAVLPFRPGPVRAPRLKRGRDRAGAGQLLATVRGGPEGRPGRFARVPGRTIGGVRADIAEIKEKVHR
ncbi:hypothetical protein ACFWUZ_19855 [Streptomyces sp. NPDC058646]|uniref:hypothetical protein n=1 Tax=Streptomyces sp. NPDC058646 TaxID=3346574 RepID=UPI003650DB0D